MKNEKTYQSLPVNFINTPQQRFGTTTGKDQRLVNCFKETIKGNSQPKAFMVQRGGLTFQNDTAAGTGRGIYYWNGSVWSVVGNTLYRNASVAQVLSTSSGTVGFIEYAGSVSFPRNLVVLDGTSGWVINAANVITQITDPDFPTPHVPQGAFMDGYLFVAKANTADIYNSNLDNPTLWTAGDFITAEMFPDNVIALVRQTNYIVAVGPNTVEYFYNSGVSPGTPLARNSAASHQFGAASADTVLVAEEQVLMLGQSQLGGRSVWVLDGFKPVEISVEAVRLSLDDEGTSITNAKAFCVRTKGHRFYVIQLTNRTWVFDFEEKQWHEWADHTGASKFQCDYSTDHPSGSPFMLDRTSGRVVRMDANVATDATGAVSVANMTMIATSEKVDYATMDRKFGNRFTMVCDIPAPGFTITLQWSDDDYNTWSSGRSIPINTNMPTIHQLGAFRRRAFRLTYAQALPFRMESAQFDVNMGNA